MISVDLCICAVRLSKNSSGLVNDLQVWCWTFSRLCFSVTLLHKYTSTSKTNNQNIKKEKFTPVVEIGLREAKPWRLVSLIIKSSSDFQHTNSNFWDNNLISYFCWNFDVKIQLPFKKTSRFKTLEQAGEKLYDNINDKWSSEHLASRSRLNLTIKFIF